MQYVRSGHSKGSVFPNGWFYLYYVHVVSCISGSPTQHLTEQLELDLSPLDYMMKCYPMIKEREEMRKIIGRYGLTGKQQVCLSPGVSWAWWHWKKSPLVDLLLPTRYHLRFEALKHHLLTNPTAHSPPLGESHQELVWRSEMSSVLRLAGGTECPHALLGRAHQSLGHRDHWCPGRCHQRIRGRHDVGQSRLQAHPAGINYMSRFEVVSTPVLNWYFFSFKPT